MSTLMLLGQLDDALGGSDGRMLTRLASLSPLIAFVIVVVFMDIRRMRNAATTTGIYYLILGLSYGCSRLLNCLVSNQASWSGGSRGTSDALGPIVGIGSCAIVFLGPVAAIIVIGRAASAAIGHGAEHRIAPKCRTCRYDLTGNTSGRCSECGAVICDGQKVE